MSKNNDLDDFLIEDEPEPKNHDGIITAVLVIVALAIIGYCGFQIGSTLLSYHEADQEYETVSTDFTDYIGDARVTLGTPDKIEEKADEVQEVVEEAEKTKDITSLYPLTIDHKALLAQNEDYIGWLYFQNGNASYPIVQDDGTGKYLKQTFEGKKNASGAIFVNSDASKEFTDMNTIVYGHNMKNGGMFGSLKYIYNNPKSLINPYFFIETPDGNVKTYKVFGIVKTTNKSDLYTVPQNNAAYEIFVNEIGRSASYFNAETEGVSSHSPIIMFSTCYGAQGTSNRLLVFGVLQK